MYQFNKLHVTMQECKVWVDYWMVTAMGSFVYYDII